ncbi:hypothetical protein Tco_1061110 [Tanacetum coccineum]
MNVSGILQALQLLIMNGTSQRLSLTYLLNHGLLTWHKLPAHFAAFMMNCLKIDYLTQELLTCPTYDLMKGTPYPHDLSKALPLIPNARGCLVIPFDHFINNDLEYLKGGSLSQDRIPKSMWSTIPVVYEKHAYWGTYHWGPKRHIFYGYATNMETSKDAYSKHMIIAVISLKIMKFYGYSHLEEIIVRRQDGKLYKFREGDFKRIRRQDIEDMLLLLVQGKLTNLSLDKRYALNVPLRMYTYLRKMTPYTAYPDIQGIIYQDDMNRNRLMRTDELHKFSDGTLNHVRTALNDIATGIQMEYLPKRRWTHQEKRRARVMINAIDRKVMRSLEKFVRGRPYGEALQLLQRTI